MQVEIRFQWVLNASRGASSDCADALVFSSLSLSLWRSFPLTSESLRHRQTSRHSTFCGAWEAVGGEWKRAALVALSHVQVGNIVSFL